MIITHRLVEVGKEIGVPVLNMWELLMTKAGWTPGMAVLPGSKDAPPSPVLRRPAQAAKRAE